MDAKRILLASICLLLIGNLIDRSFTAVACQNICRTCPRREAKDGRLRKAATVAGVMERLLA